MLTAQNITYIHPDKEVLFENISFSLQEHDKVALIGNNGSGKSTLLKIIAGILPPAKGIVKSESKPCYIPQHFGQFNDITIAEALQIEDKLTALQAILQGDVSDRNMSLLKDDWTIEERTQDALKYWNLQDFSLSQKMKQLSGGEKTKVFLAGIFIHQPEIVLLDEPTNHMDISGRETLFNYLTACHHTLMIVSHDRALLELFNPIFELDKKSITVYGGNYDFFKEQKAITENALIHQREEKEKELQKARKTERESIERKQRQDARGKKKHEKEGVARIYMKTLKDHAESSTAKLKSIHSEKLEAVLGELKEVQQKFPDSKRMKMNFEDSAIHHGKTLITAQFINFGYNNQLLWNKDLNYQIRSGERINVKGKNGSGKTTLIRIFLGELNPTRGIINRVSMKTVYIDQDYSLILNNLTIYEQAQKYNDDSLPEQEIKIRLHRYLFNKEYWDKPCSTLSGGEKMRLMLCCLMISNHAPDLFVLDEPTNNLDIQNIKILTSAINEYSGTLLVVSHDNYFLNEINVNRVIEL